MTCSSTDPLSYPGAHAVRPLDVLKGAVCALVSCTATAWLVLTSSDWVAASDGLWWMIGATFALPVSAIWMRASGTTWKAGGRAIAGAVLAFALAGIAWNASSDGASTWVADWSWGVITTAAAVWGWSGMASAWRWL